MIFNNKTSETYVSPICRSIAVKVEGVLCGSYKSSQLPDSEEEDWGTF